jgi:lipopolysaccharide transport system ATP-binding protein
MTDLAIRVRNLSKRYTLGSSQTGYATLRETLASTAQAPARWLRSTLWREQTTKPKNDIWALKDVSFDIHCGEVVGVIGRNGAGKSTLLKILSRITDPTEGSLDIYGRVGSLLEVGTGFHPELTGRENIYLNGAILGMHRLEIEKKFDEIVAFAEIEKFIDTPVKHYSSGMYLRLAFAVAAHMEPEILLVDEVLAVGDMSFQKKCMGKMGEVAQGGRTVLFVSHNMGAISQLCPSCLWIDNGRIKDFGETSSIVSSYLWEDNGAQPGEIVFPEIPEKKAQLRAIKLLNSANQTTHKFSCDEAITIEILFQVKHRVPGLYCWLDISRNDGTLVMMSDSFDTAPNPLDNLPPGMHLLRVIIPPRTLAHGQYRVNLAFTGTGGGATPVDKPGIVYNFSLDDFTSMRGNSRPGFFSTTLSWEVHKTI